MSRVSSSHSLLHSYFSVILFLTGNPARYAELTTNVKIAVPPGPGKPKSVHLGKDLSDTVFYYPVQCQHSLKFNISKTERHRKCTAFKAVSPPEQYCSAPLLKVKLSVSDRFLRRSESSLNTFIGAEIFATEPRFGKLSFKSKGSVANCITDRASVHTGNASEQFLHHNRTLVPAHTIPKQLLKWTGKNLSGTV